jgi:hypothetical protein
MSRQMGKLPMAAGAILRTADNDDNGHRRVVGARMNDSDQRVTGASELDGKFGAVHVSVRSACDEDFGSGLYKGRYDGRFLKGPVGGARYYGCFDPGAPIAPGLDHPFTCGTQRCGFV